MCPALFISMGRRDSLGKVVPGDGIRVGLGLHQFRPPEDSPAADLVRDDDILAKCFFGNCFWTRGGCATSNPDDHPALLFRRGTLAFSRKVTHEHLVLQKYLHQRTSLILSLTVERGHQAGVSIFAALLGFAVPFSPRLFQSGSPMIRVIRSLNSSRRNGFSKRASSR